MPAGFVLVTSCNVNKSTNKHVTVSAALLNTCWYSKHILWSEMTGVIYKTYNSFDQAVYNFFMGIYPVSQFHPSSRDVTTYVHLIYATRFSATYVRCSISVLMYFYVKLVIRQWCTTHVCFSQLCVDTFFATNCNNLFARVLYIQVPCTDTRPMVLS